jgi:triosephosphate isomerase (TIM)
MRRPFIAGNWKMNTTRSEALELVQGLCQALQALTNVDTVDVAVCPPSVYLDAVAGALQGSTIGLGAQNMYHEPKGAYTGELSGAMLVDVGCRYVILGHSERRRILGESNEAVCSKVHAAFAAGLTPIVCVGETRQERDASKTSDIVAEQFFGSLAGVSPEQASGVVIAYEPVWAIGTGVTPSAEEAEEVHANLRGILASRYGAAVADQIRLQYGGSVNTQNAAEMLAQKNIDGALVGGASLQADGFAKIVGAAVS